MIKFKTLSIKNFLSYGAAPTVINLDPGGTTLIVGEDLDNTASGTGANGVGKTVWLNALVFALYGKPVSNISMDNLVNNINQEHLEVIVEFQKDNLLYVVKRVRKEKGLGSYARVYRRPVGVEIDMRVHKDNDQDVTPDSVKHINDFIAEALGIPHELFVRIVAFSATHQPFLDLPVRHASQANQSDIMEELFRLVRLSEQAALLKTAMKDTKSSLEIKQKHNEQLEKEHERHTELLSGAKDRVADWVEDNKDSVMLVKKDLKTLSKYDIDGQQKLFDAVTEQNETVTSLNLTLTEIDSKTKELAADLKSTEKEMKLLDEQLSGIEDKIDVWNFDHKANIQAHEEAKDGLVDDIILDSQEKFHQDLLTFTDNRSKLVAGRDIVLDKIADIKKDIKKDEEELGHLEDAKCPYCLQKYESAEDKIAECNTNIKESTATVDAYKESLDDYDKKIDDADKDLNTIAGTITLTEGEIKTERQLRIDLFKKIDELNAMENPFSAEDSTKLETRMERLDANVEAVDLELLDLDTDRLTITQDIALEEKELTKLVEQIEFNSLEELWEVKGNITRLNEKLDELKDTKNPHQESYTELLAVEIEPIDMDTVNHLDKVLTHQNYLLKLLTKKDSFIRKNLLNKNLAFLNTRLRGYLNDLGLPHRVEFTQEMTAHISQFGRQLDFGNLSSGQKARVNLALSFSFRDVLQRSLDSVNVCMLDEVLDVGLDSVGVQNAAHMLKRKAREDELSLFIISHRDEVSGIFDKTLTVTMEKGFSSIGQAA